MSMNDVELKKLREKVSRAMDMAHKEMAGLKKLSSVLYVIEREISVNMILDCEDELEDLDLPDTDPPYDTWKAETISAEDYDNPSPKAVLYEK